MPHHDAIALSGTITHVFAHRFTIDARGEGGTETHLADLGPKGLAAFPLTAGLAVTLEGERRPSEIKVTRIAAEGRNPVEIEHKKPNHAPGHVHAAAPAGLAPADLAKVLDAVRQAGWTVLGAPRGKPKHFEVLARRDEGALTELHVDFAGAIYKRKPAEAAKWAEAQA